MKPSPVTISPGGRDCDLDRSRRKVDKIDVVAKSDGIDFDEDVRIMQV